MLSYKQQSCLFEVLICLKKNNPIIVSNNICFFASLSYSYEYSISF